MGMQMSTTLGRAYSVNWRGRPPHMLRPDVPIWYRFLERYGYLFQRLYYDCLLGGPELTPAQERDPMQRMYRMNVCKRADAIAETDKETWLIEVADGPGLRAVGQLMVYRYLWREDPKINKPDRRLLVCRMIDRDMFAAAAKDGILIYVIPNDPDEPPRVWATPG